MKIATRRVYVVECPTCRKPVDFSGEGGVYFQSKADAKEQAELWMGCDGIATTITGICGCRARALRKVTL